MAIDDCRQVSGCIERALIGHGERLVRVAPGLMGEARRGERSRGKSDAIDAAAIARSALREGLDSLPCAYLDEQAMEIRLLCDHRIGLFGAERSSRSRHLRLVRSCVL